jgi:ATP-dependent Clp protease ATP-binding subunit ClpA
LAAKDISLIVGTPVMEYLARVGYDPKMGARPLKRVIQSKILTPVANMMVGEGMLQGGTVTVSMKKGSEDELVFDIKKARRAPATPRTKKRDAVVA